MTYTFPVFGTGSSPSPTSQTPTKPSLPSSSSSPPSSSDSTTPPPAYPLPGSIPGLLKPLKSSPLTNPPLFSPSREPSPAPRASPTRPTRATLTVTRPSPSITPAVPVQIVPSSNLHHTYPQPYPSSPPSLDPSPTPRAAFTPLASSSTSPPSPSLPLSRSHPLLGSYPLSLLHSRMSAHATHASLPARDGGFTLLVSVHGKGKGRACPPELRCPKPLELDLDARYYDLESTSQTPWAATVDLEAYYFGLYGREPTSKDNGSRPRNQPQSQLGFTADGSEGGGVRPHAASFSQGRSVSGPTARTRSKSRQHLPHPPPSYPGYRVPPCGQLQILVRSPTRAVKVFILPYDLRALPPGGRFLMRERTYVQSTSTSTGSSSPSPSSRDSHSPSPSSTSNSKLRHAIQLQFICIEEEVGGYDESVEDDDDDDENAQVILEKSYYLSRGLRVVFSSSPTEPDEKTHIERSEDVVAAPSPSPPPHPKLSPGSTSSPSPLSRSVPKRKYSMEQSLLSSGRQMVASPQSQMAFSPGSLERRAEQWARVRARYFASSDRTTDSTVPSPTSSPSITHDGAARIRKGDAPRSQLPAVLIPPPDFRPVPISSPASPLLQPSLLSTLDPRDSSPGATPTSSPRGIARTIGLPRPGSPMNAGTGTVVGGGSGGTGSGQAVNGVASGTHVGSPASRRMRRGSIEERELSERLRALGLKTAL